ncbi:hypothetical protein Snas_5763 [Stackebrandtia nassauensis DSM 44728]|uniref:Peptidase MA-like domain-containing protein n=2 Tax=Stackebrandtia TaxID=283810 RepID=D3PY64_STANL|nr:hypothetical protein Snas_5763 [Stackebrandtia nassauensis DSM 44728]
MPQAPTPGFPPPGLPGQYPPGFPPPRATTSKRSIGLVALILAAVLLSGVSMILGFTLGGQGGKLAEGAIPAPAEGEAPSEAFIKEKSEVLLDESAEGLLDGDEDTWLSAYDSSIHDQMKKQYTSLKALQVSNFDYQIIGDPNGRDSEWTVKVGLNYCFGAKKGGKCAPTGMIFDTQWRWQDQELLATQVSESSTKPDESSQFSIGARPWEVEELKAEAGDRAVVAATDNASDDYDVKETLEIAEAAAENADKYAVYGKVDKYVIFLGDDADIAKWYGLGSGLPQQAIGFALPLPQIDKEGKPVPGGSEVVLFAERLKQIEKDFGKEGKEEFEATVRHELGHVATLHHSPPHTPKDQNADWWLSEGIAELIDHDPKEKIDDYPREKQAKEFLKSSSWDGELIAPEGNDPYGSAKYGVAFYWTYYLYDEYGKDKFMDFFERVARKGDDPEEAAKESFDKSYEDILKECKKYVKKEVL